MRQGGSASPDGSRCRRTAAGGQSRPPGPGRATEIGGPQAEGGQGHFDPSAGFETGYHPADPVDQAILATRKAVFPYHGLMP